MNNTLNMENNKLKKVNIETVQINLGNKCNQICSHCHIDASPSGKRNMDYETATKIINKLNHVYNPDSDFLPPDQSQLETEHKQFFKDKYGISFI